ncbi:hypothetical protein OTU49_010356 [Cherax quadricarinatus]|uniref:Uncharacterized protein n=1 Tax=Cherax quadricarinatus TaxID=27406 RepID=A0AAW0WIT7_CHEQU|nr:UPF0739 protein C1orf74 homolog [Cherax quadricarinatus]
MALETWRVLFKECLGGRGAQYCDEVAPLLVAVDQGVKPSLLWDVCTADTSALLALLNQARSKSLLVSKLVLVELGLDVFIVNIAAVIRTLGGITGAPPTWIIDISCATPKLGSSEIHQEFRTHLNSIIAQLGVATQENEESSTLDSAGTHPQNGIDGTALANAPSTTWNSSTIKAIQIKLPDDLNLSTIFGCLLGYPHIYWWEGESGGNSLSGMPLKVFKLSANCSIDGSVAELFSFSIPEALEGDIRPGIEHWGNVVNVRIEQAGSFSNAKFRCDSVLCLSVAL